MKAYVEIKPVTLNSSEQCTNQNLSSHREACVIDLETVSGTGVSQWLEPRPTTSTSAQQRKGLFKDTQMILFVGKADQMLMLL